MDGITTKIDAFFRIDFMRFERIYYENVSFFDVVNFVVDDKTFSVRHAKKQFAAIVNVHFLIGRGVVGTKNSERFVCCGERDRLFACRKNVLHN